MLTSLLSIEFAHTQNSLISVPLALGKTLGAFIFLPIVHTFKSDILQHVLLHGAAYSILLSMQRDKSTTLEAFDKFKWFLWFRKHNIRTPAVLAIVTDSIVDPIPGEGPLTDQKYIFKPKCGSRGVYLSFETLNSFLQRQYKGSFIAQERVYDCDAPTGTRSYRVISVSDGQRVYAWMLFELRPVGDAIKTNESAGGTKTLCENLICPNSSRETRSKIDFIIDQFVELHRAEFLFIPSIGWDFMVCCDGAYALEGNVDAGIASRKIAGYKQILKKYDIIMQAIYNREP